MVLVALGAVLVVNLARHDPTADDRAMIEQAITEVFVESDPANCTKFRTQEFVDRMHFGTGNVALADCEKDEADPSEYGPDSVSITDVGIENDGATAEVAIHGGALDRMAFDIALIEETGSWKLDRIVGVDIDRAALDHASAEAYASEGDMTREEADCYVATYRDAITTRELERSIVTGDEPADPEFPTDCFETETLRSMLIDKTREGGEERGASAAAIACVETTLRSLPSARIRAAFRGDVGYSNRELYGQVIPPCVEAAKRTGAS
jgi:hypothetical protein